MTDFDFLQAIRRYELDGVIPEFPAGARVLEIGAGAGWQARVIASRGFAVDAIDVAESGYGSARVWDVTIYDGVTIPFPDQRFDVVFSSNTLEHIPHIDDFQHEIRRVLKPDGIAVHIVPSGTWRFWTNVTHYLFILQTVAARLVPMNRKRREQSRELMARAGAMSRARLLKNVVIPPRHGEKGNAFTELYWFSNAAWLALFGRGRWNVRRSYPNRLFYTGYNVLGPLLPIRARRLASWLFGSSCHAYVLEPGEPRAMPDRGAILPERTARESSGR